MNIVDKIVNVELNV